MTAIESARQCQLEISDRSGFHNSAGTAICDDGVMIDLSRLRQVEVDPVARRARVGGAAILADVDGPPRRTAWRCPRESSASCYEKSLYLDELSDEAIAVIVEQQARETSPLSLLEIYRLGGAYAALGENTTACGGRRSSRFGVFLIGLTTDSKLLAAERGWLRSFGKRCARTPWAPPALQPI